MSKSHNAEKNEKENDNEKSDGDNCDNNGEENEHGTNEKDEEGDAEEKDKDEVENGETVYHQHSILHAIIIARCTTSQTEPLLEGCACQSWATHALRGDWGQSSPSWRFRAQQLRPGSR